MTWKTAAGDAGQIQLEGDDKWTLGRSGAGESLTVELDNPLVSRISLVIRDAGPGPVVFRGQRDNGAKVALIGQGAEVTWLDEGTAGNLSAEAHQIELSIGDDVLATIDVGFEDRGSVVERQQSQ